MAVIKDSQVANCPLQRLDSLVDLEPVGPTALLVMVGKDAAALERLLPHHTWNWSKRSLH